MTSSEVEQPLPLDNQTQPANRDLSLLLLGFVESGGENRFVLMNPSTGSAIVIEGSLTSDQPSKYGPLPASKAAIEAIPAVKVTDLGLECAICLGEYEIGGEAKEMPCKHRFHSGCIEKWLRIHGSCPNCRYKMPVGEDDLEVEEGGVRERRVEGAIRINFFVGNRRDLISSHGDGSSSEDTEIHSN
ncbi:E3 ubiquitin-protein like [Actinidia chinensis var. chinensis]|uniref:RING-type E3 ubiquitin transferase n=1 Tax=Actinidia chinensis var. chinensis TaxID=1590841 RepID=A0A2R6RUJ2_ACTCC|nr:E3 ubiquitin-protein like [Actinidia chinensis var. chinensis]